MSKEVKVRDVLDDVINTFGLIDNPLESDATYILRDGSILDTKGPYENHQHENIAKYVSDKYSLKDLDENNGSKFMNDVSAIRVTPWFNAFYLPKNRLTEEQEKVIFNMISDMRITKDTPLMISTLSGDQFIEYDKVENPDDVLNSIFVYYTFGLLREEVMLSSADAFRVLN